jgi:hypothetical protein
MDTSTKNPGKYCSQQREQIVRRQDNLVGCWMHHPSKNVHMTGGILHTEYLRSFGLSHLSLSRLIFSHKTLFILPVKHYSSYQSNRLMSKITSHLNNCTFPRIALYSSEFRDSIVSLDVAQKNSFEYFWVPARNPPFYISGATSWHN